MSCDQSSRFFKTQLSDYKTNESLKKYMSVMVWGTLITLIVVYSVLITSGNRYRLVSGAGIFGFLAFGYLMSEHKEHIKWNQVLWGISLQFALALLVLRTNFGKMLFSCIGDKITNFLKFTDEGSSFLFGYLVSGQFNGIDAQHAVFAFKASGDPILQLLCLHPLLLWSDASSSG
jgi:hypothetical protein